MLDATQKRELGRVRERPRAKHNGGRRAAKRTAASGAMTAVRSGRGARPGWPELAVGVVGALWRWRVELALLAGVLLAWRLLAGAVGRGGRGVPGRVGARGGAGVAARRAGCWRGRCRGGGCGAGSGAADRRGPAVRRLGAAAARSGRRGARRSGCASGGSIEDLDARRERLAASIGLREVRVTRDPADAARGTVTLVRRDPLAGTSSVPWPHASAEELSLWEPVPVGVDELGQVVSIGLVERNVLMGGEPGAGKSAALSLAGRVGGARSVGAGVAAGRQAGRAGGVGAVRRRLAGPDVGEAIELLREVRERDGAALPRAARLRRAERSPEATGCRCTWWRATSWPSTSTPRTASNAPRSPSCCAISSPAAAPPGSSCAPRRRSRRPTSCRPRCATCSGSGWRCAATRRRPRTRSSARAGRHAGYNAAQIAAGQRGVGLLLAEDGLPGARARLSPRATRTSRRSPGGRARCAPTLARSREDRPNERTRAARPSAAARPRR